MACWLAEAESLMRRTVVVLRMFFERTGHQHPHFFAAVKNYLYLLSTMKLPAEEAIPKALEASGLSVGQLKALLQKK